MFLRRSAAYGAGIKRKRLVKNLLLVATILAFFSFSAVLYLKLSVSSRNDRRQLRDLFESGEFENAYTLSSGLLKEAPLDSFLLTIHGFSAYQLAIAQTNNFDAISYIDNCIWSLRKAMLYRENLNDGRISYVLGKAYYNKGSGYADLAVNYLEKSRAASYRAADIPEYLGLAYAGIRDFRSSVEAFSLALTDVVAPSDLLMLSIARSYLALEEFESARAYLMRCLDITKDSKTTAAARLALGNTLVKTGDTAGAETEYLRAIEEDGENAEAHYQLGELYALAGDATRARAEWRRAVRIDPAHGPARSRLN